LDLRLPYPFPVSKVTGIENGESISIVEAMISVEKEPGTAFVEPQGQKCPCCGTFLDFETHGDYKVAFCCGRTYSDLTVYVAHKAPKLPPVYYGGRKYHFAADYQGDWRQKYQWE
jgi:hypothetical protein